MSAQWVLTRDVFAATSGGGEIDLPSGTVLLAEPLEYQTDPDWCAMQAPDLTDEAVFVPNDAVELVAYCTYCHTFGHLHTDCPDEPL